MATRENVVHVRDL